MSNDYLTVEECDEIRRLHGLGLSKKEIGRAVGRHQRSVYKVLDGEITGAGPGPGRVARCGVSELVEAAVVPWAPWVPEPEECAERVAELSVSQRHVLELLAAGYTPKQAARLRGSTAKTVSIHMGAVLRKLGVSSQTQSVIILHRAQGAV